MPPEEKQNTEEITQENPASTPLKQEVVESVPTVEEVPSSTQEVENSKVEIVEQTIEKPAIETIENTPVQTSTEEEKPEVKQFENIEVEKTEVLSPIPETVTKEPTQSPAVEQNQDNKTEEITKVAVNEATPTQEIKAPEPLPTFEKVGGGQAIQKPKEPPQPPQTQEIPKQAEPQIIEKIVYQTPPNLIQNLLSKARAKIQERKRKKLNKIMLLFETKPVISNSDIQELLRTTKRSATRYLNILEKEQKIIQVGKAGRGVRYVKR